jgi:hypothetical protein
VTAPKSTLRRRRLIPGGRIPDDLVRWFSGIDPMPWSALLWPDNELLADRWRAWLKDHPGAKPPEGLSNLIDLDH